jgi:hypothetical protein
MNIKENTIVTAQRDMNRVTTYRVTTHNVGEFEAVYGTRVNSKTWKDSFTNNLEILRIVKNGEISLDYITGVVGSL